MGRMFPAAVLKCDVLSLVVESGRHRRSLGQYLSRLEMIRDVAYVDIS